MSQKPRKRTGRKGVLCGECLGECSLYPNAPLFVIYQQNGVLEFNRIWSPHELGPCTTNPLEPQFLPS